MNFTFRQLLASDHKMLCDWLNQPHVSERWGGAINPDEVTAHYFDDAEISTERIIACLDGNPLGFIQTYWAMEVGGDWWQYETDPGTIGIDFFIGDANQINRGIGSAMLRQFSTELFQNPRVTNIVSDPSPANPRSIKCLSNAGFTKIGIIQTPDGQAVLMKRTL